MQGLSRYLLVVVVAALAALAALWVGKSLPLHHGAEGGRLHAIMHEKLDLNAEQEAKIDALEVEFAQKREALEAELDKANRELAVAVTTEHEYGPAVERAVDHSHMAMGELQKATLSHVFAMRAVLTSEQAAVFDKAVAEALTDTPQD